MSKKGISIFFSIAFLLFIVTPTILLVVDDTIDVSVIFSNSEEEEKGSEKEVSIEVFLASIDVNDYCFNFIATENKLVYFYKKYTKPQVNIISPPPDLQLL